VSNLDFYSDDPVDLKPPKSKKRISGVLALVAALIGGTLYIQTTLAANISLNSGSVEFGQGITQTVACSGSQSLTITPLSTFVNASGSGAYKFSGIRVDNIPTSCQDTDFTFSAYNNVAASAAQAIFNTSSTRAVVYMKSDNTFEVGTGGSGLSVATNSSSSFTVTFTAPVAPSSDVNKVTVESAAHLYCSDGGECAVGDTGPGGGIIFYYQSAGFTCGEERNQTCNYLEAAPDAWNGGADPGLRACYGSGTGSRDGSFVFGEGAYNTVGLRTGCYDRYSIGYDLNETADNVVGRYSNLGYSDWFIASKPELNELCKYSRGQETGNIAVPCNGSGSLKSGFTGGIYLSSSSTENMKYRHDINFSDGSGVYLHGYDPQQIVRPIRAS
jgi:hypothetical protein